MVLHRSTRQKQTHSDHYNVTVPDEHVYQSIHTHLQEVNTTLSKELPTAEEIANAVNNVSNSTQQIELLKQLLQSDLIPAGSNKDDIIKLLDSIEQTTTAVQGVLQNRIGDLNNAVSGDHTAIKAAANLIDAVMPIVEKQLQADVATMKGKYFCCLQQYGSLLKQHEQRTGRYRCGFGQILETQ